MFHYLMLHYFNDAPVVVALFNASLFDDVLVDVALFTVALFYVALC